MNFKKRLTNTLSITSLVIPGAYWISVMPIYNILKSYDGSLKLGDFITRDFEWLTGLVTTHTLPFLAIAGLSFLLGEGFKLWHTETTQ